MDVLSVYPHIYRQPLGGQHRQFSAAYGDAADLICSVGWYHVIEGEVCRCLGICWRLGAHCWQSDVSTMTLSELKIIARGLSGPDTAIGHQLRIKSAKSNFDVDIHFDHCVYRPVKNIRF